MNAKENCKRIIRKGIIGMVIGLVIISSFYDHTFLSYALGIACFTGVPYGWELSGRVITFGVVGSLPIMIIFYMMRLVVALLVGWIAYPIALIRAILRLREPEEEDVAV